MAGTWTDLRTPFVSPAGSARQSCGLVCTARTQGDGSDIWVTHYTIVGGDDPQVGRGSGTRISVPADARHRWFPVVDRAPRGCEYSVGRRAHEIVATRNSGFGVLIEATPGAMLGIACRCCFSRVSSAPARGESGSD